MLMNKRNSLKVQSEAYDVARQVIWRSAEKNQISKKTAERMLVDLDNSLKFNEVMLHDMISGKDADFVIEILDNGQVRIGHQAQALYFTLNWEDIHKLSKDIKNREQDLIRKKDKSRNELEMLLANNLISKEDYDRYMSELPEIPVEEDGKKVQHDGHSH